MGKGIGGGLTTRGDNPPIPSTARYTGGMPYASNAELPPAVKKAYSGRCQSVFRRVFNDHDGPESGAFAVAHTAAKNCMSSVRESSDVEADLSERFGLSLGD